MHNDPRWIPWQLQKIMEETDYLNPFQLSFGPGCETETALVTFMNNLWREQDKHSVSLFALLDLSASYNTIGHGILLGWLQREVWPIVSSLKCAPGLGTLSIPF